MTANTEYYECHITIIGDAKVVAPFVNTLDNGDWAFSAIDGDIVLGAGVKCYATTHFSAVRSIEEVGGYLNKAVAKLQELGCVVVRAKIERVLVDIHYLNRPEAIPF